MNRIAYTLLLAMSVCLFSLGCTLHFIMWMHSPNVAEQIAESNVAILTDDGFGSGTVFIRRFYDKNGDYADIRFVMTAAHVVNDYKKVMVVKDIEEEPIVGKVLYINKVLDICVLILPTDCVLPAFTRFSTVEYPRVGTHLYQCGSPFGKHGHDSISEGILSYSCRHSQFGFVDQTTTSVYPGASGGSIRLLNGDFIGITSMYLRSDFNYHVPMRVIRKDLAENDLGWLVTGENLPSVEEFNEILKQRI